MLTNMQWNSSFKWPVVYLVYFLPHFAMYWTLFYLGCWIACVRHLGFVLHSSSTYHESPSLVYDSSTLKAIRKGMPKQRIDVELWTRLKNFGIRKPVRSKRRRLQKDRSKAVLPYTFGVQVSENNAFGFPCTILVNVRSLVPKLDELYSLTRVYEAGIVCLTETWLNNTIMDSIVHAAT